MTNTQLWIAVAIPSVLVIISWVLVIMGWMQQDKRLARLETQFDTLTAKMDAGFARLEDKMDERFRQVNEHLLQFYQLTGRMDGRIDELSKR